MSSPSSRDEDSTTVLGEEAYAASVAFDWSPGTSVGRYALIRELGRGGMGVVLRAYDTRLQREVALKVLHRRTDANARKRIIAEAQAMAQINHPNVVAVYDVHEDDDGVVFIAMELVEGPTLHRWLKTEEATRPRIIDAFVQAGRGLAAAHARGLVHRDFKPGNVLLGEDGRVRVTDFGLVRLAAEAAAPSDGGDTVLPGSITDDGVVVGTPRYMAPEQHRGEAVDARCDQYAFCVALYEALAKAPPFEGATPRELLRGKESGPPRLPSSLPASLGPLTLRGLSVRPEDRWPSMDALLVALSPRTRRMHVWVGAGALALLATAALQWSGLLRDDPCGSQQSRTSALWSAARQSSAHAGLVAVDLPFADDTAQRVSAAMTQWAGASSAEMLSACRGEGDLGPRAQVVRAACLQRGEQRFVALAELFAGAEPVVVVHAVEAVAELPEPQACRDAERLAALPAAPDDPEDAQRAATIAGELDRARAVASAGRYAQARDVAEAALLSAQELGYAPMVGEALWVAGEVTALVGDRPLGLQRLEAAYAALAGARAHREAGRVAMELAFQAGAHRHDAGVASSWVIVARALVDGYGATKQERARLEYAAGVATHSAADYVDAVEFFERAVALSTEADPTGSLDLMRAQTSLGGALADSGQLDRAQKALDDARALAERLLGAEHPEVAALLNNTSVVATKAGRPAEGIALSERALAIRRAALGPGHPESATTVANLAAAKLTLARYEDARADLEQALPGYEASLGPDDPKVAHLVGMLALTLAKTGHDARAEAMYRRALRSLETRVGPHDRLLAPSLLGLSGLALARGDAQAGREFAERSLALHEDFDGDPLGAATSSFLLARALWDLEEERPRAVQLAKAARDRLESLGSLGDPRRAEVDAWLAAR